MVARYIIETVGYYHHHKGFESYVRCLKGMGQAMSRTSIKNEYEKIQEVCVVCFQRGKELLAEMGKEE
nr:hypothetical protein [Desulfobulbaceae bacterium]